MAARFDILKFLEEYQRYPCLWQKKCADFKNRVKRHRAENRLLPMSGFTSITELRQKIRNIRCTYNQEVAKIKKSMETGTGTDDVYYPKLAWFPFADSFLGQNREENDSESNLDQKNPQRWMDVSGTVELQYENGEHGEEQLFSPIPTSESMRSDSSKKIKRRKANEADEVLADTRSAQPQQTDDEWDVFGMYVASEFKSLTNESRKKRMKIELTRVMLKYKEEELE